MDWIGTVLTCVSLWRYGSGKIMSAALIGLAGNGTWALWSVGTETYSVLTINGVLAVINLRNLWRAM